MNNESVSVPRELTPEMREAFHESYGRYEDGSGECPDSQWRAMLRVAPQPAAQHQCDAIGTLARDSDENVVFTLIGDPYIKDGMPVFAHADTVEVERLQRRIQNADLALKVQAQNCDTLRAQLAERDALLREAVQLCYDRSKPMQDPLRIKIEVALSASAEPEVKS